MWPPDTMMSFVNVRIRPRPASSVAALSSRAGPVSPVPKAIVAEVVFESILPAFVHIAPAAAQSSVAASVTVTSSLACGRTVIVQRWFCPCAARFARITRPFATEIARSLRILWSKRPGKFSLNRSSKLNSDLPSWLAGTSWNVAASESETWIVKVCRAASSSSVLSSASTAV